MRRSVFRNTPFIVFAIIAALFVAGVGVAASGFGMSAHGIALFICLTGIGILEFQCLEHLVEVSSQLERPSGYKLCWFLGCFCTKKYRENVLEPAHAEAIADYLEAEASGDHFRALIKKHIMVRAVIFTTVFTSPLSWVLSKIKLKIGGS